MELETATIEQIMTELGKRYPRFIFFGVEPDADTSKPNAAVFCPIHSGTTIEAIGLAELFKHVTIEAGVGLHPLGPLTVKERDTGGSGSALA